MLSKRFCGRQPAPPSLSQQQWGCRVAARTIRKHSGLVQAVAPARCSIASHLCHYAQPRRSDGVRASTVYHEDGCSRARLSTSTRRSTSARASGCASKSVRSWPNEVGSNCRPPAFAGGTSRSAQDLQTQRSNASRSMPFFAKNSLNVSLLTRQSSK